VLNRRSREPATGIGNRCPCVRSCSSLEVRRIGLGKRDGAHRRLRYGDRARRRASYCRSVRPSRPIGCRSVHVAVHIDQSDTAVDGLEDHLRVHSSTLIPPLLAVSARSVVRGARLRSSPTMIGAARAGWAVRADLAGVHRDGDVLAIARASASLSACACTIATTWDVAPVPRVERDAAVLPSIDCQCFARRHREVSNFTKLLVVVAILPAVSRKRLDRSAWAPAPAVAHRPGQSSAWRGEVWTAHELSGCWWSGWNGGGDCEMRQRGGSMVEPAGAGIFRPPNNHR